MLIYSIANVSPAFADDGVPPAPTEEPAQPSAPTEEPDLSSPTVDIPTNDSTQVDEAPAATSDTLDQAPTEDFNLPSPTDTVNDTTQIVQEPTTMSEVLDQIPADTAVVVTIDGQIEPLATQDAADAIVAGDPVWCPGSSAPGSG